MTSRNVNYCDVEQIYRICNCSIVRSCLYSYYIAMVSAIQELFEELLVWALLHIIISYTKFSWRTWCCWSRSCSCTPWCKHRACSSWHSRIPRTPRPAAHCHTPQDLQSHPVRGKKVSKREYKCTEQTREVKKGPQKHQSQWVQILLLMAFSPVDPFCCLKNRHLRWHYLAGVLASLQVASAEHVVGDLTTRVCVCAGAVT